MSMPTSSTVILATLALMLGVGTITSAVNKSDIDRKAF